MTSRHEDNKPRRRSRWKLPRWLFRCFLLALAIAALSGLAIWLLQRSMRTNAKKRALQSWMDEKLNADVSLLGEMVVRLNLVRDSRVVLRETEIEHPNPVFPGKLARIGSMGAWAPPWAVAGLFPGRMKVGISDMHVAVEESQFGDWSLNGLMRPLAVGNTPFPFPFPKISNWRADISSSSLEVKRRGYELAFDLNCRIAGRNGRDRFTFHSDQVPFSFGRVDIPEGVHNGTAGPVNLTFLTPDELGDMPAPVPGACEIGVKNLPVSMLPFFVTGIPLEEGPGVFNGLIRYDQYPEAAGALYFEGNLADVPLGVFGLPPQVPLRLTWPLGLKHDNTPASVHMGPAGYGAFELTIPLGADGSPKGIVMRGDVAALDEIPAFFTRYKRWPQWVSRTFPRIEWRSGAWRGFGWEGKDLLLSLTRSTAGMNLTGVGEMLGGRIRLSAFPDQEDGAITVAGERLDAAQLASKLSTLLPENFRLRMTGKPASITWRAFPSGTGDLSEWGAGLVWPKPVVDMGKSGAWWRGLLETTRAVAEALPEWGGGDAAGLLGLAALSSVEFDQMSIVVEHSREGWMTVEFRAYGDTFGQATGILEMRRDGAIEGEFVLAGPSAMLNELMRVNTDFARALDLIANETRGLRVGFSYEPGGKVRFAFPFLGEARTVHENLKAQGK